MSHFWIMDMIPALEFYVQKKGYTALSAQQKY